MGIGIGMQYRCTPPARRFRTYAPTPASTFKPNERNGGGLGAGPRELRKVSAIHVHYITTHRNAGGAAACPSRAGSRRSRTYKRPAAAAHGSNGALQDLQCGLDDEACLGNTEDPDQCCVGHDTDGDRPE